MRTRHFDRCVSLVQFVRGDITNTDFVLHILKEEQIDTIMNFAAQVCHSMHPRPPHKPVSEKYTTADSCG